jgi:uncharacterized cupin superfamily protein
VTTPKIVRFEPHGPAGQGLKRLEDIPAEVLASGTPVQRGHSYLEVPELGLSAGVWDCTPMTTRLAPYPVNEFMIVLEGAVTIVDAKGGETTVKAGESFILPKGLPCAWKQTGYMRKFYVIFDDASGLVPADPAALAVIRPDPAAALAPMTVDPAPIVGKLPKQHVRGWFEDLTGQWTVGVWDATPYERKVSPFPRHELMHLLEGSVTLTDGQGGAQTFTAGDTFFVPMGAPCGWKNAEYVRKIYCIFQPRVAMGAAAAAAMRA